MTQKVGSLPARRPLKIFSSDPMTSGLAAGSNVATVNLKTEQLLPGPAGARVTVIDYDREHRCYYRPVDLNDTGILMSGGLEPSESDPRFHQQMVYAVGMKVLENFDRALGRSITFRGGPLRVLPHAFHGANAYFDPNLHAILFGYFRADRQDPGPNLPGQNVFTCLSHDIIAHEMTHALVYRLRKYFLMPSNVDVRAFHEGFSDIVALFQHFSFQSVLRDAILVNRADLRKRSLLVELAQQFGHATGNGRALRSALGMEDKNLYETVWSPHERGSILVAAVFDAFFMVYERRIRDLIRISTGGTGNLPDEDLHPDLVNRVSLEAARTAQSVLTMCIRAFEYLPPVDVTFGDYLRALVTADYELSPEDEVGQRAAMIESFRRRGIYPENVFSLAEQSLLWPHANDDMPNMPRGEIADLIQMSLILDSAGGDSEILEAEFAEHIEDNRHIRADLSEELHQYATANAGSLGLNPNGVGISVQGFHWTFRVASDGMLKIELVSHFVQSDVSAKGDLGGIPFMAGSTVISDVNGRVRYVISKPMINTVEKDKCKEAVNRYERQKVYADLCASYDSVLTWRDDPHHMKKRTNFLSLHQGII